MDVTLPPHQLPDYIKWCNASFGEPAPCYSSFVPQNISLILENPIGSVNADFSSTSRASFAVNVSWDHPFNPAEGYRLRINNERGTIVCLCIYNPNLTNIKLFNEFFRYLVNSNFDVELSLIYNSPKLSTESSKVSYDWPGTCLDITHTNYSCGLPVYHPPSDLSVYYMPSDNQTLYTNWRYQTKFPLPTVYYIEVYDPKNLDDFHSFITHTTSSEVSIVISTQFDVLTYTVLVVPYVYCSGLANRTYGLGCGIPSLVTPTMFLPSSSASVPTSTSTGPTQIATTQSATILSTTPLQINLKIIIGTSVAAVVSIVLVFGTVVVLMRVCYRVFKQPPLPPPPPPNNYSVFVVYAPQTASERDILKYIVCRLEEYFDVVTSSDIGRGDVVKLIEERERKANAILLVCTEEFRLEWEDQEEKSHLVAAIQTLLSSAVVQERLDKYAILVLDDKSRGNCIPDNHYLSNMGIYVLGKARDQSVLDELYRFVTKQIPFQHCHVDRGYRETSAASVLSSTGSSDLKSRCTESVSIDLNLGSSMDSEDYGTLHRLGQFVPEKDAPAPTQAKTLPSGSSLLSGSSGSSDPSEQAHQLLTLLQGPGACPDTHILGHYR